MLHCDTQIRKNSTEFSCQSASALRRRLMWLLVGIPNTGQRIAAGFSPVLQLRPMFSVEWHTWLVPSPDTPSRYGLCTGRDKQASSKSAASLGPSQVVSCLSEAFSIGYSVWIYSVTWSVWSLQCLPACPNFAIYAFVCPKYAAPSAGSDTAESRDPINHGSDRHIHQTDTVFDNYFSVRCGDENIMTKLWHKMKKWNSWTHNLLRFLSIHQVIFITQIREECSRHPWQPDSYTLRLQ